MVRLGKIMQNPHCAQPGHYPSRQLSAEGNSNARGAVPTWTALGQAICKTLLNTTSSPGGKPLHEPSHWKGEFRHCHLHFKTRHCSGYSHLGQHVSKIKSIMPLASLFRRIIFCKPFMQKSVWGRTFSRPLTSFKIWQRTPGHWNVSCCLLHCAAPHFESWSKLAVGRQQVSIPLEQPGQPGTEVDLKLPWSGASTCRMNAIRPLVAIW